MTPWSSRVLGAFVIAGCGARPQSPAPLPAPEAAVVKPDASADTPEREGAVISGRLLAHDGSPLRKGEVIVRRHGFEKPLLTAQLDAEGAFFAEVQPGAYMISIAAVDHAGDRRETIVSDELRVEGQLGTYARTEPGDTIRVRAEFLDAKGEPIGPGPTEATRIADAEPVYRLDLAKRPEGATRLRYQLASGAGGRTYNGPVGDAYESDHGGDFWSVVDLESRDVLTLDMAALPPAGEEPRLSWSGESPHMVALLRFQDRWSAKLDALQRKIPRKDGKILAMTEDDLAELAAISAEALAEVEAESDPTVQDLLRAGHIAIFTRYPAGDEKAAERDLAWTIDNIAPDDLHLSLLGDLDFRTIETMGRADPELVARVEDWLDRRARSHPDPAVAIRALQILLDQADRRRDDERMAELYARATHERFEGTYFRKFIAQKYDPDRILQRGKALPSFQFAALENGDRPVTREDLEGRVYLLEFWATWCAPCVNEMPKLHEVYAQINGARRAQGKGDAGLRRLRPNKQPKVEFVFVSLDREPAHVEAFRRKHWSMPWTHAFVGSAGEKDVMKRFGFSGVPTAILVDETGTILEVGEGLRREALLPTLQRVLAERPTTR